MATRRGKQRSRVIREERFERSMDVMTFEMAGKTAESLYIFHQKYVSPLEGRIRTIELLLGIAFVRWCYWKASDGWYWLLATFGEEVPDEPEKEDDLDPDPPTDEPEREAYQH